LVTAVNDLSFIDGASEGYSLVHASRAFLFRLEPDKSVTLQAQLRRMLVSAILDGQILPGAPCPPAAPWPSR
jgi:hypothetical protein